MLIAERGSHPLLGSGSRHDTNLLSFSAEVNGYAADERN
jgi:hypothetical protein